MEAQLKVIAEIVGEAQVFLPAKRQDVALSSNPRHDVEFSATAKMLVVNQYYFSNYFAPFKYKCN